MGLLPPFPPFQVSYLLFPLFSGTFGPPCCCFLAATPSLFVVALHLCFFDWYSFPSFLFQVVFGATTNKQKQASKVGFL